ncbi:glyoxylate/hydroxypyruvate reductase A [Chelativorans sp. Marseille-P2723]|uniref:2-hydroxyacid dehydrogenase n=1 Tax=Chelativorans sp. Marseille-P2723 TaxID=2709133 RepID=UPI001570491A|nr:glyoxylate/hydroxypyruvate reductase A [Chelativorans sp. Marseille-P2723]
MTCTAGNGRVLLSITGFDPTRWYNILSARRAVVLELDGPEDPSIEYAVVWKQPRGLLKRLPNLKAIFSIGAGVDHVLADPDLPDVPVVRVVSQDLTQRMVEYVVWRVLDHHRQGLFYRTHQQQKLWRSTPQPVAGETSVGIMGLGALGSAAAGAMLSLGFAVNGWSRREKSIDGVTCYHGDEGLTPFLAATDILVVLLPLTRATRGIIDFSLLERLRQNGHLGGPCLINAGRGGLQREADILQALDENILKEASLDVFEQEPLDPESRLWTHPRIFITPHISATSQPDQLGPEILAQMEDFERGEPLRNVVDRDAGY